MDDGFAEKVREVLRDPQSLPQEFRDWIVQHTAQNPVPLAIERAQGFQSTGLTGSTATSRYVGATSSGHPTTGYHLLGDFVIDQSGTLWICIAAGDPGTWKSLTNPQTFIGARIQATSTQSIADSTNTDLVYQSVLFDTDSMANLASDNKKLTVNTAGIYLVVCCTQWAANGTGRRINVAVHNGLYSSGSIPDVDSQADNRNAVFTPIAASTGRTSNTSVGIYQASVGDYFTSGCYQASGAALNANGFANCFLSALLVGS